jgi:hypothetical protein
VQQVACGDTHTLAVLDDGRLFSFGRNQNGQLGNGGRDDRSKACAVSNLAAERVTGAACGAEHSVCVTTEGRVFAWGWGSYGNLGNGCYSDECAPILCGLFWIGLVGTKKRCTSTHVESWAIDCSCDFLCAPRSPFFSSKPAAWCIVHHATCTTADNDQRGIIASWFCSQLP